MSVSYLVVFVVCFLASLLGPLCGIGGGVIIKPIVDALGVMSVSAVSFLSSVSVLTMSLATLVQNSVAKTSTVKVRSMLPIALGSAVGGVCGKMAFNTVSGMFPNADTVGAVQAAILIAFTVAVLLYTLNKKRIGSLELTNGGMQALVGFVAGACWSFLGIGGGPFNLAILVFFFSMESKPAAQASLFIIAFSQTAGLLFTLFSGSVPEVSLVVLVGMCLMAVLGSIVGRKLVKNMDSNAVDRLYLVALLIIVAVSAYNFVRFCGVQ